MPRASARRRGKRSKRSKGYNLQKNAGAFLNIVGVAAVAAVAAHTDIR